MKRTSEPSQSSFFTYEGACMTQAHATPAIRRPAPGPLLVADFAMCSSTFSIVP